MRPSSASSIVSMFAMNEPEVRALVRDVIARRLSGSVDSPAEASSRFQAPPLVRSHASHGVFLLPSGSDSDGPCLIEPAVMCNHCGYCKSFGH